MRALQIVALFLWRGGLLLAGGWLTLEGALFALRFADVPGELRLGFALILAGAALVVFALIAERIVDYRSERHSLRPD